MTRENEKRRFCLIGPAYPYRGGISHYNTCLIRELSAAGDVRAINFTRLYPGFLFPGKTQLDESERPLAADSERLIDSINPFTWIRAGARAARGAPDLVLVQWWHPFFAPAMFTICLVTKLLRRSKVVFICHNVLPHEKSLLDRLLAALAFSVADGFLVQSREDRKKLLRIRRNVPVLVHPHPIYDFFGTGNLSQEAARAKIGSSAGPLLLFFGLVRPYKGLSCLIEAMPLIREKVPAKLLVVGEFYEETAPYLALVERLGLGDAVRFENRYVANEEVEGYFVASDLVVLPYVSATQSGIVQIAVAMSRPVVVTDVGGLSEAVAPEKTGFVVPPRDPAALAGAVVRFFEEGWAAKMAPRFEEEKKRFSWKAMAGAIDEIAGLIGKRRA
jgi:glycosyltransferase involved in cell wall biosynthesis